MLDLQKKKQNIVVYLVDENELDSKILEQKFLLSSDYEINTFTSGEKLLSYLISKPAVKRIISIVILDYNLNSINIDAKNGIEVLKSIKDIDPEIEVIMLSSKEDVDIVTSSIHYGAVTFIRKNENSFQRIQNNINWIISRKLLNQKKKASKMMSTFFISVFLLIIIVLVMLALFNPGIFES